MSQFNEAMKEFYETPKTPQEAIKDEHLSPTGSTDIVDHLEIVYGKGMFIYLKGYPHPVKGAPTPEAMTAQNRVKRILINSLTLWPTILFVPLNKLVYAFNRVTWDLISSPYILKDDVMNPVSREIKKIIYLFLINLNIPEIECLHAAKTLSHIVEYDNAYRYRLMDIMQETDSIKLSSPKEIRRLGRIIYDRDDAIHQRLDPTNRRVGTQVRRISKLVSFILYIPKYRKALKKALAVMDMEAFNIDEGDAYWMSKRKDYNFNGVQR